jgi:hypothetical protein
MSLHGFFRDGELSGDLFIGIPSEISLRTSISRKDKASSVACSASSVATSGGIRFCPA